MTPILQWPLIIIVESYIAYGVVVICWMGW